MRVVGALGLSIDLAFHWSAADNPASPVVVLRELFVDADPGSAWWLVLLGVAAHVMFFGVFVLLMISRSPERRVTVDSPTTPEDPGRSLHEPIAALGPAPRAELLHVLRLPECERAERIGEFYRDPKTRPLAHLLIDLDKSPHARSVLLGELQQNELRAT